LIELSLNQLSKTKASHVYIRKK